MLYLLNVKNYKYNKLKHIYTAMNEEDSIHTEENYPGYNLKDIYNVSNDKGFVKDMIQLFIKSTSEGLAAIRRGIKNDSWEYVAHQAHKISAPCKHIKADRLYLLLKNIEEKVKTEHSTLHIEAWTLELEEETTKIIRHLEIELIKMQ
jgi:HPt (histidine-containing phosphotransfer) domain-containing protein